MIGAQGTRLTKIAEDVLIASRLDRDELRLERDRVDLGELVRESVETMSEHLPESISLVARTDTNGTAALGDRSRIEQVLVNLIDNAVKYSPAGDEVEVSAAAENGTLRIAVRDNGPGIAPEHQLLIFEKFGRAKVAGKAKPGTGLGLFIARSIAEAHGGSIEVASAPERGATFTLELPA